MRWALLLLASCAADWNAPLPTTPEPGAPCGLSEHECADHACCGNGTICGGEPFSGCAAESCCEGEPDAMGVRPSVRAKRAP